MTNYFKEVKNVFFVSTNYNEFTVADKYCKLILTCQQYKLKQQLYLPGKISENIKNVFAFSFSSH